MAGIKISDNPKIKTALPLPQYPQAHCLFPPIILIPHFIAKNMKPKIKIFPHNIESVKLQRIESQLDEITTLSATKAKILPYIGLSSE